MARIPVHLEYLTGLRRSPIVNARLSGGWDGNGRRSEQWSVTNMEAFTAEDGCPAFRATVSLDDSQIGETFHWGVRVDTARAPDVWGLPTEVNDPDTRERYRSFVLRGADQRERFYLTNCRRLGANVLAAEGAASPAARFAVWAPNAQGVEVVFGESDGGYIYNNGTTVGGQPLPPGVPLQRGADDVWETRPDDAALADYRQFDHRPYMFRITKEDGSVAYRTDLYSRCQIGSGGVNPEAPGAQWSGRRQDLDGSKSCSVVINPERVCELFEQADPQGRPVWPETRWLDEDAFWENEFDPARPLPERIDDLVIYEMHVDGLGLDRGADEGTLLDAMNLVPYLRDLGVNCVELMPMSEFQDRIGWGYSTSHYMAIEYSGGGRDKFKHFVRECHRNGIAVLLDVVYNHYTFDAERAEWQYDSNAHEHNIYYWYEGHPSDYPSPDGGYVDNGSSGFAPRFWEEPVRKMFCSSAAALLSEFHFDGFRVDLTTALHRDNVRHADGRGVPAANEFGQKLLREWTNTLRLIKPNAFLIAEDHSGWSAVTQPTADGGLGFDVTWYADYYHHLIGDAQNDASRARLLKFAGYGDDRPLAMTWFAGALAAGANRHICYHESHDEAGNSYYIENGQEIHSARTIMVAVNGAPLIGEVRRYAEARVHFTAGMTLLGPGIPMFFMGEEVGASRPYLYADFIHAREDYFALRQGDGARLFRFYADLIRFRLAHPALRSGNCEIVHTHDANRVLAFRRWTAGEEMLVVGSLNNGPFNRGYEVRDGRIADGQWREVFNSDAAAYGGNGLANAGTITSAGGAITVNLPANSVLVLRRQ